VVRTTIGAPAAVLNIEEAIALGLRRVVTFGSCGSLVNTLPIGSFVIPSFAISDEGTSRHYGRSRHAKPDPFLVRSLREVCLRQGIPARDGGTWTTDAPYRESRQIVRRLARRGVISVDMETSALYQVAGVRGAKIASLFVVSDELAGPEWNPGFDDPRHVAGLRRAATVVLEALGGPRS
jgi:purine-nucleoside phosphorylase